MKRLIWALPQWCHNLIFRFTGWRLVKVADNNGWYTSYIWTDRYPYCPPRDD